MSLDGDDGGDDDAGAGGATPTNHQAYWAKPESWRKSARRNLNYHMSSSRLLRFKSTWADFSLNLTGEALFRVARPYFKRMIGVCSRAFRRAHFTGDRPPALLFSSNNYAEVPVFHELLNLKLKKLVKGFFKDQEKRDAQEAAREYRRRKGQQKKKKKKTPKQIKRANNRRATRLEKICLGRSCIAQGAAACATMMKDLHIGEHFDASVLADPQRAAQEVPFSRLIGPAHSFGGWEPVAMHLVQRTQWHFARSPEDVAADEAKQWESDDEDVDTNQLLNDASKGFTKPSLSPFGNHKVRACVRLRACVRAVARVCVRLRCVCGPTSWTNVVGVDGVHQR